MSLSTRVARVAARVGLALALAHLPRTLLAQAEPPPRPRLESAADTNDWEAYYTRGALALSRSATAAEPYFYWAARLNPGRAEGHFARWVSFWRREQGLWEKYLAGDRDVLASPPAIRADSFLFRAMHRNPFVDQSLTVLLYTDLSRDFRGDPRTVAWLRYAAGDYGKAAEVLGKAIARRPDDRRDLGYDRALALVALGEIDSAAVEISALLADLRRRERAVTVRVYESKELLEYGLGLLMASRGDTTGARQALERALTENLAFAPAHDALGRLALLRGDTATAVRERGQAVELFPDDGYLRQQYGAALLVAGRGADALEQFRKAIALEPYFADPYYGVAASYDLLGDAPAAGRGYRDYLLRAPRRLSAMRQHAARRVAALPPVAP